MLPTIVTSRPRAAITNQCHRLHGNRSILAGIRLSTTLVPTLASLNLRAPFRRYRPPRPRNRTKSFRQ